MKVKLFSPTKELWRDKAACKGMPLQTFYYESDNDNRNLTKQNEAAKAICKGCPVSVECLSYSLNEEIRFGVWGGFTSRERGSIKNLLELDDYTSVASKIVNQTLHMVRYKHKKNEL
jgi:WhiB family transcriptional regulator, redox-sensing transcriptional regulator